LLGARKGWRGKGKERGGAIEMTTWLHDYIRWSLTPGLAEADRRDILLQRAADRQAGRLTDGRTDGQTGSDSSHGHPCLTNQHSTSSGIAIKRAEAREWRSVEALLVTRYESHSDVRREKCFLAAQTEDQGVFVSTGIVLCQLSIRRPLVAFLSPAS
jgi:hypothetical protein